MILSTQLIKLATALLLLTLNELKGAVKVIWYQSRVWQIKRHMILHLPLGLSRIVTGTLYRYMLFSTVNDETCCRGNPL